jgi:hypothetical protein
MQRGELSDLTPELLVLGFRHFSLGLANEQLATAESIQVAGTGTYDNFGANERLEPDIADFLEQLGNDPTDAQARATIITRLIGRIIVGFGTETAWTTIRAWRRTDAFNVPRWHADGYFYPPWEGDQLKAVLALKGDSTRLCRLSLPSRVRFVELQRSGPDDQERTRERAALVEGVATEHTPSGHGTVLITGSQHAAVHSEPPIPSERLFVSVMPGTSEQIAHLRQRWKQPHMTEIKVAHRGGSITPRTPGL